MSALGWKNFGETKAKLKRLLSWKSYRPEFVNKKKWEGKHVEQPLFP